MNAQLAVQVVNYATAEHLGPCLRTCLAALEQTPGTSRILVLDNASGDDLSGLRAAHGARVEFAVAERNLGFGGGHNRLAAGHDVPAASAA